MNLLSIQKVSECLDSLALEAPMTLRMFDWVRKNIAWATYEAVYGPSNPFRDPDILTAFWCVP